MSLHLDLAAKLAKGIVARAQSGGAHSSMRSRIPLPPSS
jgi:hypothetical protein